MNRTTNRATLGAFAALAMLISSNAFADTCVKAASKLGRGGKVTTKLSTATRTSCKKGEVSALTGPAGATGATGPQGAAGTDGSIRIYGNGSAGAKTVAANETLADTNLQYTDVTVNAGTTLTIPSGTVIRCTGTFTNNGTVTVSTGAAGAQRAVAQNTSVDPAENFADPGVSSRAARSAEVDTANVTRSSGAGGAGLGDLQARSLRYVGVRAGGAGGAAVDSGSAGGGSLLVLCKTAIVNNGTVNANAAGGAAAGGGGGVVILASQTAVTLANASVINAKGGTGQSSDTDEGASGGGGGGIVHLLAPTVTTTGATIDVSGGTGGTGSGGAATVTSNPSGGGGGGGASGGNGGAGGSVSAGNIAANASDGLIGDSLTSTVDPTSLF